MLSGYADAHWSQNVCHALVETLASLHYIELYVSMFSLHLCWPIGGLPMCVLSYIFAWHRGSSGQRPWVRLLHSFVHCHLARLCKDLFSAAIRDRERSRVLCTKGRPLVKSNLICPSDKLSWRPGCPFLNINIQGNFCISQGNGSSDNLPEILV